MKKHLKYLAEGFFVLSCWIWQAFKVVCAVAFLWLFMNLWYDKHYLLASLLAVGILIISSYYIGKLLKDQE